jgi:hypothetical protein
VERQVFGYICVVCPYKEICTAISGTVFVVHDVYLNMHTCIHLISLGSWTHTFHIYDPQITISMGRPCKKNYIPTQKWPVFGI